jgi:hypothetical protein
MNGLGSAQESCRSSQIRGPIANPDHNVHCVRGQIGGSLFRHPARHEESRSWGLEGAVSEAPKSRDRGALRFWRRGSAALSEVQGGTPAVKQAGLESATFDDYADRDVTSSATDRPASSTIEHLVRESGHRPAPSLRRLGAQAMGAQLARRLAGVNASPMVTRTSALWAAMVLDEDVAQALANAGITRSAIGAAMRINDDVPVAAEDSGVEFELDRAVRQYVDALPPAWPVGVPHVVAAIILDAQQARTGLLPGRLRELKADTGAALAGLAPLLRPAADRADWVTDAPALQDFLGRQYLAQALSVRLRRLADSSGSARAESYLVHLDGPWGSGKSTLFEFLKKGLDKDFLVVSVNAWREQRVGIQWWTLYQSLCAARRKRSRHKRWESVRDTWDAVAVRGFSVMAVVVAVAFVSALGLWLSSRSADSAVKVIDSIVKSLTLVGLLTGTIVATRSLLLPYSKRGAKNLEAGSANPMEEVRRLFVRALSRAKMPVVFLIDDLDRCDEDYVVRFLEVVQTLVRDAVDDESRGRIRGPYCFVAADGQWLRSSFENHYQGSRLTEVPGRPLGYLFLEKVFQLHVRLPTIPKDTQEMFYASLLQERSGATLPDAAQRALIDDAKAATNQARSTSELRQAAEVVKNIADQQEQLAARGRIAVRLAELLADNDYDNELLPFAKYLEPNPRSMKLFINHVGIQQSLRALEGVNVSTAALALWSVVETRWPVLADDLRQHPEHLAPDADDVPRLIRKLMGRPEVCEVLHGHPDCELNPKLVRQCTGGA